jgi:hypothetical protein
MIQFSLVLLLVFLLQLFLLPLMSLVFLSLLKPLLMLSLRLMSLRRFSNVTGIPAIVGIAAIACVSSVVNTPFPLVLAIRLLLESPDVPVLHLALLLSLLLLYIFSAVDINFLL